ncbi:MAG: alpha/beta fold hydrolase, partial [Pseudomonadota bacterium]|nr:alpha/beta fold hydrolase [Pseudomonadota bacterium]
MPLAFDRVGVGASAFVFVHGFGCAREDWAAQAAHFKEAHTCLSVDLPGFGESPPLPDGPSMQAFGS